MQQAVSPEITGEFVCAYCGNTEYFIGTDNRGWGGKDACHSDLCYAGFVDVSCYCETELVQAFQTEYYGIPGNVPDEPDMVGQIISYEAHTGGEDGAEIGAYTKIECGNCRSLIWEEQ